MKKRIILCILALLGLLVIACGKSDKAEDQKTGILDSLKNISVVSEEQETEKYNAYVDLYNELGEINPIYRFDEEYSKIFIDKEGNYQKSTEKGYIETFAMHIESKFRIYDEVLDKAEKYINEKPKYEFDSRVKNIINLSRDIKKIIIKMSDYYTKGFYLDDDFKKGKKFDDEYIEYLYKLNENAVIFMDEMEKLEDEINTKELARFEKEGLIIQLNTKKVNIVMDELFDFIHSKEDLNFSTEDLNFLKEKNAELIGIQAVLEKATDKQIEEENFPKNVFRNRFLRSTKTLIEYTTSLITRIEKKQSTENIEKAIEEFSNAYSDVINEYNSMIN